MALTWAHAALGPAAAARYGETADERWRSVLALVEHPDTAVTSSAGRLFDAVAALLGLRSKMTYEGQAAIELEAAAAGVPHHAVDPYPAIIERGGELLVIDPSPLIARVVAERDLGTPVAAVSAAFHAGLGRTTVEAAVELAARHGLDTVALSGGVFQNTRLTEVVVHACREAGLSVLVHERVPPNDGGISIGQAAIAAFAD